jgi:hypothetical protein
MAGTGRYRFQVREGQGPPPHTALPSERTREANARIVRLLPLLAPRTHKLGIGGSRYIRIVLRMIQAFVGLSITRMMFAFEPTNNDQNSAPMPSIA